MAKALKLCKRDQTLIESLNLKNDGSMYLVTNPYSGASEKLNETETKLYEYVKKAEIESRWDDLNKGITLFRKLNGDAYYTLLD